jgi:hypothetical protein
VTGFSPSFQIAYVAFAIVVFVIFVRLTRARARRVFGALASVAVFIALSAPIDNLARRMDWWTYPSCVEPSHPPLLAYVGQALIFVGTTALVGWRVQRAFGGRVLAVLVVLSCLAGLVRDLTVAAIFPQMIRFGGMPASVLADLGAWAMVAIVGLGVTRIVAGPAEDDAPRGERQGGRSR